MIDFVPARPSPDVEEIDRCAGLLKGRRFAVLTGAGCSTESGIPDYRGPKTRQRTRNPVQYQQFVHSDAWRRRYWSRAMVGWPRMRLARPSAAHYAIARLQNLDGWSGLITQNVDGLHRQAGSRDDVELHGTLDRVICLDCRATSSRDAFQRQLVAVNPSWVDPSAMDAEIAPDGDVELERDLASFVVPPCPICHEGTVKPDVVFFGENVPRPRVERAYGMVDDAEVLLVAGSSLTVFSGYRFPKRAAAQDKPIVILNCGPTRADPLATLRIDRVAGAFLTELADALSAQR